MKFRKAWEISKVKMIAEMVDDKILELHLEIVASELYSLIYQPRS